MAKKSSYEVEIRGNTKVYRAEFGRAIKSNAAFSQSMQGMSRGVTAIDGPLGGVAGRISALNGIMSSGALAVTGFGVAFASMAYAAASSVKVFDAYERGQLRTQALIKSSGNAAGLSAEQLQSQADAVALATLASVGGIQEAQNVLQSFHSVSGETFNDAIRLSQDMAAVFGGTAKDKALQLGKALEDPVTGLNALKRSGVSFTRTERELVKSMVEAGDTAKAQGFILDKLRSQVGGAGAAEAGGLSGSVDTMSQRWDELRLSFAKTSSSAGVVESSIKGITKALNGLRELIDPTVGGLERKLAELEERQAGKGNGKSRRGKNSKNALSRNIADVKQQLLEIKASKGDVEAINTLLGQTGESITRLEKALPAASNKQRTRSKGKSSREKINTQLQEQMALQEKYKQQLAEITAAEKMHADKQAEIKTAQLEEVQIVLDARLEKEQKAEERRQKSKERAEAKHLDELAKIRKEKADAQAAIEAEKMETLSQSYEALSSVIGEHYDGLGGKQSAYVKTALNLGSLLLDKEKRDSLKRVWMYTSDAAMGAYRALASIPYIGPALGAAAAGVVYVAGGVAAAKITGMAHSGMTNIPTEGTYLLDGGERVVKPEQNRDLTNFLRSGNGSGQVVNIYNHTGAQVEQRQNGDQLDIVIGRVKDSLKEDVGRGVGFANTLQSTYGLSRKGVA